MGSPFPGMDPYLERHWHDVHASLIYLARVAIQEQLGEGLFARAEERLVIESEDQPRRSVYPDVHIIDRPRSSGLPIAPSGVAVAAPLVIEDESEPAVQRFIEIIDAASGGRVVTVIEFVSPSNKVPGDGHRKYRQKQQECVEAGVSLVEIDLTRAGRRELLADWHSLPSDFRTTYSVCVYRAWARTRSGLRGRKEVYAVPLRQRLPAIAIPLRETDKDVALDLQPLIDEVYRTGRYDRSIDYGAPLDPPLEQDDAAWARGRLQGRLSPSSGV